MAEHKAAYVSGCRCDKCKATIKARNLKRGGRKRVPKVPFDPIIEAMSLEMRGIHSNTVRANAGKEISIFMADRWCVKLGYHPWTIYGDLWFRDIWESNE